MSGMGAGSYRNGWPYGSAAGAVDDSFRQESSGNDISGKGCHEEEEGSGLLPALPLR
jgi:hypothetical protein